MQLWDKETTRQEQAVEPLPVVLHPSHTHRSTQPRPEEDPDPKGTAQLEYKQTVCQ